MQKCGKIEYRKKLQTVSLLQHLDNLYDEYNKIILNEDKEKQKMKKRKYLKTLYL